MNRLLILSLFLALAAAEPSSSQVEFTEPGESGFGIRAEFFTERIGRAYNTGVSWIISDAFELGAAVAHSDVSGFTSSGAVPAIRIAALPLRRNWRQTRVALLTSFVAGSDLKSKRTTSTGVIHSDLLLSRQVSARFTLRGQVGYELGYRLSRDRFVDYIRTGAATAFDLSSRVRLCLLTAYSIPIGSGDAGVGIEFSALIH